MAPGDDRAVQRYRVRPQTVATDVGEGPPIVLCHGTLMDRTMFRPQLDVLSDDYRVVAYDTRARTDQYNDSYDLYDLADDCAALIDAKGIDSCVLGGMSMGGFMSLRFASRYPERVDGLILIDTTAGPHQEHEIQQYKDMIETTRDAGEVPEGLADLVKHILFGDTTIEENPGLVAKWVDRWLTYPADAVYYEVDSWLERPDYTDQLDDINVPVLVIHGEEDTALELSRSETLVEGLDARRVVVPDAGHSSNLEIEAAGETFFSFTSFLYLVRKPD